MTIESGNKRHPADKGQVVDAVLAAQGRPAWTTQRTLDPVRAAALTAAVNHFIYGLTIDTDPVKEVLNIARQFEQYLTGEEADGTT